MSWWVGVLIVVGCMVGWKLTSKEMHDPASPEYSQLDHYGWWAILIILVIVGIALLIGLSKG